VCGVRDVAACRLVAPERADDLDGVRRGFGAREQEEAARDEHVGGEDVDVRPLGVVTARPWVRDGEPAGEPEPVVDELDADGTLREFRGVRAGALCCDERQHAGDVGAVGDERLDVASEALGDDVGDGLQCGLPDRDGVFHRH